MADSFNLLQEQVRDAALGLDEARENMRTARAELLARHEQIAHLAHHDPLTDLPNRTLLAARLAEVFERAKTHGDELRRARPSTSITSRKPTTCSATSVGDELLCAVARRLEIAADGAFIARVGGDEFTLVSATGRAAEGRRGAGRARARRRSRSPSRCAASKSPSASASAPRSIRTTATDTDDAARQCRRGALSRQGRRPADGALLRSRYGPAPPRTLRAAARPALGDRPRRACSCTISRRPRSTARSSASRRWSAGSTRSAGSSRPSEFIPLAEQNGMIVEIGAWALREACREAASWAAPLQIGVNLSPVQFRYGDLAGLVHFDPAGDRPGAGPARAGDHRRRHLRRSGARAVDPAPAEVARRQDRHGRFRHRLCVDVGLSNTSTTINDDDGSHYSGWIGDD